ncbi:MAG: nucleoside deaminase [Proteobacteria bacterium]|nr:nucleoside deaminase [Pseudomonadota bacterium]NCA28672.1 nucleoside deaminase [Pseudomonadota bacterium]
MTEALAQAELAFHNNEVPVGAIIVENGQIIARAHNQNLKLKDPTAHAEILAIRQACKIKDSNQLNNCDIYVTLEPCAMCLSTISYARIRRIYFGAHDQKFGAVESNPLFSLKDLTMFKSEIYSGINSQQSINLLKKFFELRRNNKS